jgi:4-hydroxybenzoate polyprenyltransferase
MGIIEKLNKWRLGDALVLFFLFAVGVMLSNVKILDIWFSTEYLSKVIIFSVAFILLSVSLFFAINDYFDYELDRQANKTRNPLVSGKMSKKVMLALIIVPGAIGAALTYLISIPVFILTLLAILSIVFYSAKPFRFKERFLLDIVSHSLTGFFLVLIGYVMFAPFNLEILGYALVGFLFLIPGCINPELRDYKTDKQFGLKTTVVTLGPEKALLLSKVVSVMTGFVFVLIFLKVSLVLFLFVPLIVYILWVMLGIKNEDSAKMDKLFDELNKKRPAVVAAVSILFIILALFKMI